MNGNYLKYGHEYIKPRQPWFPVNGTSQLLLSMPQLSRVRRQSSGSSDYKTHTSYAGFLTIYSSSLSYIIINIQMA